jgi:hypothetical protein
MATFSLQLTEYNRVRFLTASDDDVFVSKSIIIEAGSDGLFQE